MRALRVFRESLSIRLQHPLRSILHCVTVLAGLVFCLDIGKRDVATGPTESLRASFPRVVVGVSHARHASILHLRVRCSQLHSSRCLREPSIQQKSGDATAFQARHL